MGKDNAVNTQITDSVIEMLESTVGSGPSHSMAVIDSVMAETMSMHMHNAVTTQHNAKLVGQASMAQTCARILAVQSFGGPVFTSVPGPAGPKGPPGDMGQQGLRGAPGSVGAQGPIGAQGVKGAKGEPCSSGQTTRVVVPDIVVEDVQPIIPEVEVIAPDGQIIDPR
ncbi:RebB family R body protein [Desulfovibrio ferrophilus]|uniref:Collagen triple helix repeat protein n=1 Tax=Desulfovibrio ferrophilus TaxID=241368 RepID=A0A2Z6B3R3_9BACT|nr:RebB family R body protein [Desulfovibrio ferrophilus]BBD10078.1 uncharacterized protein DFE_3352 [Desulfovibrio ferrophilus]